MPNAADRLDTLLANFIVLANTPRPDTDVNKAGFSLALEDEDGAALLVAINGVLKARQGGVLKPVGLKSPVLETLTDAATVTPNVDNAQGGNLLTASQAFALANPTGTPLDGQEYTLRIKSTTSRVITPGSQYRGGTLAIPSSTTGSSKTDILRFRYNAADTKWDLTSAVLNL